jgi:phosphosulfolactate phosphohydrolase-like enzyme
VKLSEKRLGIGVAIRLENDSGKRVLDTLKFMRDIKRCTTENRVGVVEARTDEGMNDKRRCVVVKAWSNVS